MNWTTICRISGLLVVVILAIFMALEWPHFYTRVGMPPMERPRWDAYVPVAGILVGLILIGCTLRPPWVSLALAWLGCAVGVLWLVDLVLFAGCRFDSMSIAIAVLGSLCVTYGLMGRLVRPVSLVLLLLASSCLVVLVFLGVLVVANNAPRHPEIKGLPALVRATPEQAAAYVEWVKLVPPYGQDVVADPDRDAFEEAIMQVYTFGEIDGDLSDIKPLLPRMQPFLNKYWSFLAANEPVPPSHGPNSPRLSYWLSRMAAQMEMSTIRSLLDDGNIEAAEERYVRALKGVSNCFAGAHSLREQQANTSIANLFVGVLVANSDRFFLEANSLHPGLDPQPSAAELSAADLQASRFSRFSATQDQDSLLTILSSLPARMSAAESQAFLAEGPWMNSVVSSLKNETGNRAATSHGVMQRLFRSFQRGANARRFEWPFFDADETRWLTDDTAIASAQATASPVRELDELDKMIKAKVAQIQKKPLRNITGRSLFELASAESFPEGIWRNRVAQAKVAAVSLGFQYRVFGSRVPVGVNPLDENPFNAEMRDGAFWIRFADRTNAPPLIGHKEYVDEIHVKPM